MLARVISIPFRRELGRFDDAELVRALAQGEVSYVREHFFLAPTGDPGWTCFLLWEQSTPSTLIPPTAAAPTSVPPTEAPQPAARSVRKRDKTRERGALRPTLDERGSMVQRALREWRTTQARASGVPAYRVLTNRQTDAIAQTLPTDTVALETVEGIGRQTRLSHGDVIIGIVRECLSRVRHEHNGVAAQSIEAARP